MAKNYTIGKQEPMEIETIPIDPERLEVIKQILEQNKMILDFVLEPFPKLALFDNKNIGDMMRDISRINHG